MQLLVSTTGPATLVIKAMHRYPEENGVFPFDEGSVKAVCVNLLSKWIDGSDSMQILRR